ncbi:4683_t:CDS:2 [Gigaspora rosea]|nr:4683_t:CDS:2 [Gigaspora rosea]
MTPLKLCDYCQIHEKKLKLAPKLILDSLITMFLRRSKGLEELSINDLHILPTATTLLNNMSGITQLKTLQGLMNKLALKVVPSDASDALVSIMKSHKKLEKLELDANRIARSIILYNVPNSKKNYVKRMIFHRGCITKLKFIKMEGMTNIAYVTYEQEYEARSALSRANAYFGNLQITVKPPDDINYTKFFPALKYLEDSLKELTLHYIDFSKISPKDVENISKCQNLVRIKITGLTSLLIDLNIDQIIITLISMWGSTLKVLHLEKLNQEIANALIIHCSNLKEFVISNLNANSFNFIYTFLQQSSLKSLHINGYRGYYEEYLNLVPKLPTTLTFLGLNTNIDELKFQDLVKYCGNFFDSKTLTIKRL